MPGIKIDSLNVIYNDVNVLNDFTLYISDKSFTSIVGPSGIGKTSLINAIMGFIPYSGTISFTETPLFAAVFQEDRLCEGIPAFRNVALTASPSYSRQDIIQAFAAVGLDDCTSKRTCLLSGGMKRRVAIIRALMSEHNLLILDEPFKGLDADTKLRVMNYVKEKASSDTVLMITHDTEEAKFFGSNILMLQ